mgnify:CR=1 FL=1
MILPILLSPIAYSSNLKSNNNYPDLNKDNYPNSVVFSKDKSNNYNLTIIKFSDIKSLVIENNEQLKKLKSQITQAKYLLKSKNSFWSPRLNLSTDDLPSYSTGDSNNKLSTNSSTNQSKIGMSGSIEWDIIKPSRRIEINIAKESLESSEYNYEFYKKDIYLEAVKKYFLIQASLQDIKVSKKAIDISMVSLKEAENKYSSGIGNKLELLEAKTQLGREQILLKKRQGRLNFHKNDFSKILNIKGRVLVKEDEDPKILGFWNLNKEKSLSLALRNRNDIKVKEKNISINQKKALSVISGKKPTLSIYNTYSLSTANGESGVENPNHQNVISSNSNKIGLKFGLNLFDGGLLRQNYRSLKSKEDELRADLNEKKLEIDKEINNSFIDLDIARSSIMIAYEQVQSANESLNISLKRLEAGLTTQREIVNLQGDVSEAETNYINSIKNYNENLFSLLRTVGTDNLNLCGSSNNTNDEQYLFIKFAKEKNLLRCEFSI